MELHAIDGNPVPDGATVGTVVTADGVRLRFARWRTSQRRSLGTVCILQGRGEQIERYFETIGDLRRRGFAVTLFDWRGQGGSERRLRNARKAHVDSFAEYDRDLEAFSLQVMLPDCPPPHYALGHSMGALIALRAAYDNRARYQRMVLSAPLVEWGPTRPRQPTTCRIAAGMTAFGLGEVSAPGDAGETITRIPFEGNALTGDPVRFARNKAIVEKVPQVAVDGPTFGWLHAACRASREAIEPDFGPSIKIPTLIVIGSLDRVVSVRAVERLAAEMRAGGQVVLRGGLHELLSERDVIREQVFAAFDAFVPGT